MVGAFAMESTSNQIKSNQTQAQVLFKSDRGFEAD